MKDSKAWEYLVWGDWKGLAIGSPEPEVR